jgi:DNA-binding transcriptional LysR family regulator
MIDAITLDQFRTFVAAVDEHSFSAAGRKIGRAQSVVSQSIANLEDQLRVPLFDRSGRYPSLTNEGQVLISDAREIIRRVDLIRAKAKGMAGGLEAELSVVIDVMFPLDIITEVAGLFARRFPTTPLLIFMEAMGTVAERLMTGQSSLGVTVPIPDLPQDLHMETIMEMRLVMVAAPTHPLAQIKGPIPRRVLSDHTQIVLTDQSKYTQGRTFGVISPSTWKLTDFNTKRGFLIKGLGWGGMPISTIQEDLDAGRLVVLQSEDDPVEGVYLPMSVAWREATPPGPAGRWFMETLREYAGAHGDQRKPVLTAAE